MAVSVAKLRLTGDPFLNDPSNANDFYLAAGRYMMVWGNLECHFNFALLFMLSLKGAKALLEHVKQEAPASLSVKATSWRLIMKGLPALSPMKKAALAFITDFMEAAQDRNELIHSGWDEFTSTDPLVMKVENLSWKGGKPTIAINHISIDQIEAMTTTATKLNDRLTVITVQIAALP